MPHQLRPPHRRSLRRALRAACALLAVLLGVPCGGIPAVAATDASDVIVDVVDASGGAPIGLARVLLQGESGTIGYTDAQGHARFESVATGSYRAAVAKRGFAQARSPLFRGDGESHDDRAGAAPAQRPQADRHRLGQHLAVARVARGRPGRRAALPRRFAARRAGAICPASPPAATA